MDKWINCTDQELIDACLRQVSLAQRALFDRYASYSMSIIIRYVKDVHYSEDVFLRAFEKIFKQLKSYNNSQNEFKFWLRRIMINESLNYIRSNNKLLFVSNITVYDVPDEAISTVLMLETDELQDIIAQLKSPYDIIFNMVVDGYKYKEISEILLINEATCRSYYMRSKIMLLENFKQYKKKHIYDVK